MKNIVYVSMINTGYCSSKFVLSLVLFMQALTKNIRYAFYQHVWRVAHMLEKQYFIIPYQDPFILLSSFMSITLLYYCYNSFTHFKLYTFVGDIYIYLYM